MDITQIKEVTKPIINGVWPISGRSLDLVAELIEVESYEKGDLIIGKGKRNNKDFSYSKAFVVVFYIVLKETK